MSTSSPARVLASVADMIAAVRVLRTEPVLALGAQLNFNYRVAGVGVDGFATLGDSRSYYGVRLGVGARMVSLSAERRAYRSRDQRRMSPQPVSR